MAKKSKGELKEHRMSRKDYVAEHKRLINTLSHPTKAKIMREKKLQEDELFEFFAKM